MFSTKKEVRVMQRKGVVCLEEDVYEHEKSWYVARALVYHGDMLRPCLAHSFKLANGVLTDAGTATTCGHGFSFSVTAVQ